MNYRKTLVRLVMMSISFLYLLGDPAPGLSQPKTRPLFVPGEILVKYKQETNITTMDNMRVQIGGRLIRRLNFIQAYHFQLLKDLSVPEAVDILKSNPNVEYVSPNYYRYLDFIPSDPGFGDMWALDNAGQTGGTADADIDAPEAWNVTTGDSDTVIAVIDSGTQLDHIDLADNIWANPGEDLNRNGLIDPFEKNGIDDDGNGFVDDFYGWDFVNNDNNPSPVGGACLGHGTHTAGTIAAVGNNGLGVSGVNWDAKLMVLNAFQPLFGIFCLAADADLIEAIEYATLMGAKVSSNSWGGGPENPAMQDAIRKSDMLFVAATGNGGLDGVGDDTDVTPHYPSSYDLYNIVSVAATDHNDIKTSFSNFGAISVDLGAPGSSIWSTLPFNSYGFFSGTSMSTPHVAGVAGLLLAQDPNYTVRELKWRLLAGVDPIIDLEGKTSTGGRLNAFKSLALPQASETGVTVEVSHTGLSTVLPGESLEFSVLLENNVQEPIFVRVITYLKIPSGYFFMLKVPFIGEIPGSAQISGQASIPLPSDVPQGIYRLFVLILNPDNIEEDVVEFHVTS